jgi:hypothetical protein
MERVNVIQRMDRVHVVARLIFQAAPSAKAPNPKSQAPNKSQAPMIKGEACEASL